MSLPKAVHIQECCPRDGWQNHAEFIPTLVCAVLCIVAFILGVYTSTAGGIM